MFMASIAASPQSALLISRDRLFTLWDMTAMVRSSGVIGYSALMRSLGVDPKPLLKKHGLPLDLGENDDVLVPVRAIVNLEEDSAAATNCPDFGLRLAATEDIRVVGPLAAAIQNAETVGEALQTASRYL